MFIFNNDQGQTLVTDSNLATQGSFSLPEIDRQINALVTQTVVTPAPAVQIQGTLGGRTYINVFGEDPMQVQISGIVVGRHCDDLQSASSALGVSVDFFAQHGVINRAEPLEYTIRGQPTKQAFMVGLTVSQDSAFADIARFQMLLFAESLSNQNLDPASPISNPDSVDTTAPGTNTGLINRQFSTATVSSLPPGSSINQAVEGLLQTGNTASVQLLPLLVDGFEDSQEAIDE